jgi:hypothetical protein
VAAATHVGALATASPFATLCTCLPSRRAVLSLCRRRCALGSSSNGGVSNGLVFRHADGTLYNTAVSARAAASFEEASRALRSLGFREGQSRAALAGVRTDAHSVNADTEKVIRLALGWLAPS